MKHKSKQRKLFTEEEYRLMFPLDLNELESIWGTLDYGVLFLILAETGFRPSEACGLSVDSVFLKEKGIITYQSVDMKSRKIVNRIKTTDSGMDYKVAILSDDVCSLIGEYISKRDGLMFHKQNGDLINCSDLEYVLKKTLSKLNLPIDRTPYCFRHTFMTNMAARYPREAVMELMGHTTWESVYDHRTPQTIIEQARRMINKS